MKKLVYALCLFTLVYLGLHMVQFQMNEPYRNRFSNEAYLNGEISLTYYDFI